MEKIRSKVISLTNVSSNAYIVKIERRDFEFKAGQYLALSVEGQPKAREYSIYSSEQDDYIELLIKELGEGEMSRQLKHVKIGTEVEISGPYGYFTLPPKGLEKKQAIVFVAAGTGIAPFRSIIRSNQHLNYTLLHGVRNESEAYNQSDYDPKRYVLCSSGQTGIGFGGRVSDYIQQNGVNTAALYYLCGSSQMVNDTIQILSEKGIDKENIKTEVFY